MSANPLGQNTQNMKEAAVSYALANPFFVAVCLRDFQTFRKYLSEGLNPNHHHPTLGGTPLDAAAFTNNIEAARILLKAGANVNLQNYYSTPCGDRGSKVYPDQFDSAPLHSAAERGHIEMMRLLLEHGANINIKRKNGFTSLSIAIVKRQFAAAMFLIQQGADVDMLNGLNVSPLHILAVNLFSLDKNPNGLNICSLLVQRGASLDRTFDGSTPLLLAEEHGNTDLALHLRKLQVLKPLFQDDNCQSFANKIELKYLRENPKDILLTQDRKRLLEIINQELKEGCKEFFENHEEILKIAEETLKEHKVSREEIETFIINEFSLLLDMWHLRPRDTRFLMDIIEFAVVQKDNKNVNLEKNDNKEKNEDPVFMENPDLASLVLGHFIGQPNSPILLQLFNYRFYGTIEYLKAIKAKNQLSPKEVEISDKSDKSDKGDKKVSSDKGDSKTAHDATNATVQTAKDKTVAPEIPTENEYELNPTLIPLYLSMKKQVLESQKQKKPSDSLSSQVSDNPSPPI